MKVCLATLILFFLYVQVLYSQSKVQIPRGSISKRSSQKTENWTENLKYMPQASLDLSENLISLQLNSRIAYQLINKLRIGVGGNYVFSKDNTAPPGVGGSYYGGSVFAQYSLWKIIFVQTESEAMRVDYFDNEIDQAKREWQFAWLAGAGIQPKILGIQLQVSLDYNLNHDPGRSWRRSPWVFRFGFSF